MQNTCILKRRERERERERKSERQRERQREREREREEERDRDRQGERKRETGRERERVYVCQIDLLGEPQSAHKSFPVMANILIFASSLNAGYKKR